MDSNDLFTLGDDFPDSLVADLNNSYEESIQEGADLPSVDDALARYSATFAQLPRTENDALSDVPLQPGAGDALNGPPADEPARGADARAAAAQPSRADAQWPEWQLQAERDAGAVPRTAPRPRASQTRSTGSRGSPGAAVASPEGLPRLRITPSLRPESPLTAPYVRRAPMLSGFRPEPEVPSIPGPVVDAHMRTDPSQARFEQPPPPPPPPQVPQAPQGSRQPAVAPPSPPTAREPAPPNAPQSVRSSRLSSVQRGAAWNAPHRVEPADAEPVDAEPVDAEPTRQRKAAARRARRASEATDVANEANKHAAARGDSSLGGVLALAFVAGAALLFALLFRQQSLQAQAATAALESRVADLQWLIESYATRDAEAASSDAASSDAASSDAANVEAANVKAASAAAALAPERQLPMAAPLGPAPRNLALLSEGAHILSGYTSPPASSAWWQWSHSFRADPDCMLRAPSPECWPVHNDAAVAVGLGRAADLQEVKLYFAAPSEPFSFEAYRILATGDIVPIEHNALGAGFALADATNVTQIILRLSAFSDLCIRSIEIFGTVVV